MIRVNLQKLYAAMDQVLSVEDLGFMSVQAGIGQRDRFMLKMGSLLADGPLCMYLATFPSLTATLDMTFKGEELPWLQRYNLDKDTLCVLYLYLRS